MRAAIADGRRRRHESREHAARAADLPARLDDVEHVDDADGLARLHDTDAGVREVRILQDERAKLPGVDGQHAVVEGDGTVDADVANGNRADLESH